MGLALRSWRRWSLLYLFVVVYSTSIVLFFVLARYRLPIVPALLPFAAWAALEIVRAARRGRNGASRRAASRRGRAIGWLMQANLYGVDEDKAIAQIVYRHGIAEDQRENWEGAIARYEEALRLKPGYAKCHLNLGVDLARVGRHDEAMAEPGSRGAPRRRTYYRPPYNRGLLLDDAGRHDEAAARLSPGRRAGAALPARAHGAGGDVVARQPRTKKRASNSRSFVTTTGAGKDRTIPWRGRVRGVTSSTSRRGAGRRSSAIADCFAASGVLRRAEIARLRGRAEEAMARLRGVLRERGRTAPERTARSAS